MEDVYCVKDRRVTPNVKSTARIVTTKNNRKMLKVKCAVCGITKTQFLKQKWHNRMQIQAMFTQAWRIFNLHALVIFGLRVIFFCLLHRLNYKICYVSEIFLPSRSKKLGENVPNSVKCNKHLVFITKRFIQTAHAFTTSQKNIAPHVRENRGDAI